MAFPIEVAPKNVKNGTPKCPQVKPAKSNKGLGIEAINKTVIKTKFFLCSIISFIFLFTFDIKSNFDNICWLSNEYF